MRARGIARSAAILVALPVLVGIALAEGYVRWVDADGYYTPETLRKDAARLRYQEILYARNAFPASPQRVQPDRGKWRDVTWGINARGYRDDDIAIPKPEGTVRIVVYGGSHVFDPGASNGEDWPNRVEAALAGVLANRRIEVVNAGIPGHRSIDSTTRLLTEGHLLEPDIAVIDNTWNDIKYFSSAEPLLRDGRPYKPGVDPRLFYRSALDRWLSETSQLYVRLRQAYWTWALQIGPEGAAAAVEPEYEVQPFLPDVQPSETGFYEHKLRQFRLNVEAFVAIARSVGALPVIVRQARLASADNDSEAREHIRYDAVGGISHEALLAAYAEADRRLSAVSDAQGVPLVDGAGMVPADLEHFVDQVHLTPAGSARLADGVAERLKPVLQEQLR